MAYIRKTKDVFVVMWQGEEVDETDTKADARYLLVEYNLAFRGGCSIKIKREPV